MEHCLNQEQRVSSVHQTTCSFDLYQVNVILGCVLPHWNMGSYKVHCECPTIPGNAA
uniref:Uncharacterized protein n=1 Tax=Anguilla anguilla TaxID=7936 RepID=A0A0E9VBQ5_ANGAN